MRLFTNSLLLLISMLMAAGCSCAYHGKTHEKEIREAIDNWLKGDTKNFSYSMTLPPPRISSSGRKIADYGREVCPYLLEVINNKNISMSYRCEAVDILEYIGKPSADTISGLSKALRRFKDEKDQRQLCYAIISAFLTRGSNLYYAPYDLFNELLNEPEPDLRAMGVWGIWQDKNARDKKLILYLIESLKISKNEEEAQSIVGILNRVCFDEPYLIWAEIKGVKNLYKRIKEEWWDVVENFLQKGEKGFHVDAASIDFKYNIRLNYETGKWINTIDEHELTSEEIEQIKKLKDQKDK